MYILVQYSQHPLTIVLLLCQVRAGEYAATSFSFQNLHSCTINVSHTPPPQPQQNCIVSNTEMDVDMLIASIDYYY